MEEIKEDCSSKPVCIIALGMAGAGKTALIKRLNSYLKEHNQKSYNINLDPAILNTEFGMNVDIRDSVNYKNLMEKYKLGPNGGIMTALNLFATQFDQVVNLIKKKEAELDYVLIDTPGQIEIFAWSASGQIVAETLATTYPTVLVYVGDIVRCENPNTFISNMLYSLSIMYRSKLPLVLAFNKTDILSHQFAIEWMSDYRLFEEALEKEDSYRGTLSRSLALVLDEFYKNIKNCGVSALTGFGIDNFFVCVQSAVKEYYEIYLPDLEARIEANSKMREAKAEESLKKFKKDYNPSDITKPQEVIAEKFEKLDLEEKKD